jgi:hypothetical protein
MLVAWQINGRLLTAAAVAGGCSSCLVLKIVKTMRWERQRWMDLMGGSHATSAYIWLISCRLSCCCTPGVLLLAALAAALLYYKCKKRRMAAAAADSVAAAASSAKEGYNPLAAPSAAGSKGAHDESNPSDIIGARGCVVV